jgi:AGCS family alanine or glycine:cation symporter
MVRADRRGAVTSALPGRIAPPFPMIRTTALALLLTLPFVALGTPALAQEAGDDPETVSDVEPTDADAAAAAEEDEELSSFEKALARFDGAFGEYVVGPMAGVFFLDVWAWDGARRPGSIDEAPDYAPDAAEQAVMLNLVNDADEDTLKKMVGERASARLLEARQAPFTEVDQLTEAAGPVATYNVFLEATDVKLPFIVLWLVLGALFFTFRYGFPNLRAFGHAIAVTRGVYDNPDDEGEVSHFQALSSALSATVGLGNIAGVAIAVGMGGPGAVFWMVVAAFFGMCSKFSECTLGQLYRTTDTKGNVSGGPMRYLSAGLEQVGFPRFGRFLAIAFAIMCIGGSFGGGNMFQSNQSYAQVAGVLPFLDNGMGAFAYGMLLATMVGIVIIGGIKRIGKVAGLIVPVMCAVYVLAGLAVILANIPEVPAAFGKIVGEAFEPRAVGGGFLGVLVLGFQRAAFSNEAGVGSASIAHSAAATDEPVREGIVALLEPFIDTIIVCTMTGLVVVITGAYDSGNQGVEMTSAAFDTVIPGFKYVLTFAVFMFAFSTMISWSYYGERCWTFLFGDGSSLAYKIIFLFFAVSGAVLELGSVIGFSDLMILGMAFPNILGMYFLSGKVKRAFDEYWKRLKSGEMKRYEGDEAGGDAASA